MTRNFTHLVLLLEQIVCYAEIVNLYCGKTFHYLSITGVSVQAKSHLHSSKALNDRS